MWARKLDLFVACDETEHCGPASTPVARNMISKG